MELKTIAIRVPPALHQQLVLLAQLSGRPLAEEVRLAVDEHIALRSSEVDLTAKPRWLSPRSTRTLRPAGPPSSLCSKALRQQRIRTPREAARAVDLGRGAPWGGRVAVIAAPSTPQHSLSLGACKTLDSRAYPCILRYTPLENR